MIRQRSRRALRGWAAGLALFTAALPLLGALHLASVAHFSCADDGDLVESPGVDHTGDVAHEDGPGGVVLPERHEAPRDAAGLGHDHCALAAHARSGSRAVTPRATFSCTVTVEQHRNTAPQLLVLRAQAVYRLAPKASPPASA